MRRGVADGKRVPHLFTGGGSSIRRWPELALRYISVTEINQFSRNINLFSLLYICLTFNQMLAVSSIVTIRIFWSQVFNKLIHRIGGYVESVCVLNQLTRL